MSNSIRAKFKCAAVTKYEGGSEGVELHAVTTGPGNESWSKWTPSGTLKMSITNPDAQGMFQAGKSYYIDVSPTDD